MVTIVILQKQNANDKKLYTKLLDVCENSEKNKLEFAQMLLREINDAKNMYKK